MDVDGTPISGRARRWKRAPRTDGGDGPEHVDMRGDAAHDARDGDLAPPTPTSTSASEDDEGAPRGRRRLESGASARDVLALALESGDLDDDFATTEALVSARGGSPAAGMPTNMPHGTASAWATPPPAPQSDASADEGDGESDADLGDSDALRGTAGLRASARRRYAEMGERDGVVEALGAAAALEAGYARTKRSLAALRAAVEEASKRVAARPPGGGDGATAGGGGGGQRSGRVEERLMEAGRERERRLEGRRLAERLADESAAETHAAARRRAAGAAGASGAAGGGDDGESADAAQRLVDRAAAVQAKIEALRRRAEEDEVAEMRDAPAINERSRRLASSRRGGGGGKSLADRQAAQAAAVEARNARLREALEAAEVAELRDAPRINARSKRVRRSVTSMYEWEAARQKRVAAARAALQQAEQEKVQRGVRPMSKRSAKLVQSARARDAAALPPSERLHREAAARAARQREAREAALEEEREKSRPQLSARSVAYAPEGRGDAAERLHAKATDMAQRAEARRLEAEAREASVDASTGQPLFVPRINRRSARMAEERDPIRGEVPVEALLSGRGAVYEMRRKRRQARQEAAERREAAAGVLVSKRSAQLAEARAARTGESAAERLLQRGTGQVRQRVLQQAAPPSFAPTINPRSREIAEAAEARVAAAQAADAVQSDDGGSSSSGSGGGSAPRYRYHGDDDDDFDAYSDVVAGGEPALPLADEAGGGDGDISGGDSGVEAALLRELGVRAVSTTREAPQRQPNSKGAKPRPPRPRRARAGSGGSADSGGSGSAARKRQLWDRQAEWARRRDRRVAALRAEAEERAAPKPSPLRGSKGGGRQAGPKIWERSAAWAAQRDSAVEAGRRAREAAEDASMGKPPPSTAAAAKPAKAPATAARPAKVPPARTRAVGSTTAKKAGSAAAKRAASGARAAAPSASPRAAASTRSSPKPRPLATPAAVPSAASKPRTPNYTPLELPTPTPAPASPHVSSPERAAPVAAGGPLSADEAIAAATAFLAHYGAANEEPLPPGWRQHFTEAGDAYYYHETTRESVWERPKAAQPAAVTATPQPTAERSSSSAVTTRARSAAVELGDVGGDEAASFAAGFMARFRAEA